MAEIIPSRVLNPLHIIFDIVFLLGLLVLLLVKKKYMTVFVGALAGVLYFIVDYGIFYKLQGSRQLFVNGQAMTEGATALFLLWLSMSYGFTNFVWIWLWIKKDELLKEFSLYICVGWIAVAVAATGLGGQLTSFVIKRTTGAFHSFMAIFFFLSYGGLIVYNILNVKEKRQPIFWLLAIGVLVQFGWEFALLIGGVRSVGYAPMDTIMTIIVNSLIETSPAVPLMCLIQYGLYKWRGEDWSKRLKGNLTNQ